MTEAVHSSHPIMNKFGLIVAVFFSGWLGAEAFYGTGDFAVVKQAHKSAVQDLHQLTDQVGTCYLTLEKHGIQPPPIAAAK